MPYRIVVPEGYKPGEYVKLSIPQKGDFRVQIPPNVPPGGQFIFNPETGGTNSTVVLFSNTKYPPAAAANAASSSFMHQQQEESFWIRFGRHPLVDFCISIGVGIFFGIVLFLGFVLGVLWSTDPPLAVPKLAPTSPAHKEVVLQAGRQRRVAKIVGDDETLANSPKLEL